MTLSLPTAHRRTVLKGAGAAVAATGLDWSLGSLGAEAAPGAHTPPGRLALLYLRGGMDGLSAVVPYTEAAYYDARPTIAVPDSEALDLDGQFGLHPALSGLSALYGQGKLAVVVGAGNPAGDRSHFVAQDLSEYGVSTGTPDGRGWVGRHLDGTGAEGDSLFRGLTMGNLVNASLRGGPALNVPSVQTFGLVPSTATYESGISQTYGGEDPIDVTGQTALEAIGQVAGVAGSTNGNKYTQAFEDAAALFASGLGAEVITLNIGAWDTHDEMGATVPGARMYDLLSGLDGYLSAFQADLDARGLTDVTTLVMTEFGRRVAENGSNGTDHGWAGAMFVMGSQVNGGVYGGGSDWAGLSPATIGGRGDVVPGVDYRDVLGDVVTGVLGGSVGAVLPGHSYASVGVV